MKFLISHVIQHQLKDPRIGLVTVLDVRPTEDLKEAKVYVSVFGSSGERSRAEHALRNARSYIQKEVGRNLETRNTPILQFVFDDSADKQTRIETLIQEAAEEDRRSTMSKKPSKKARKPESDDEEQPSLEEEELDEEEEEEEEEDFDDEG
jgi:ribosome-binding factor A